MAGSPVGSCPFSFSLRLHVLLRLFACLFHLSSVFGLFSLPCFTWIPSAISVGGGRSLPLFCVFITVGPSCLVWVFSPLLSFAILPFSSMWCFFVSFLGSDFLPSGCLFFPNPLSLSTWSLRVSCFLFCCRPFPLGSSSALLSVLSSGLFRHWAFPFLARSWFFVPPFLVFSLLDVGAFVSALSHVVLFLVSSHCPSGLCPSGGVPCCFFRWDCYPPYLYSGFFMRCVCLLSLRFLVLCVRSLALLSAFFRGYFCCVLSMLGVFLLLILMLFLLFFVRFCFSSFSFSDLF